MILQRGCSRFPSGRYFHVSNTDRHISTASGFYSNTREGTIIGPCKTQSEIDAKVNIFITTQQHNYADGNLSELPR